MKSNLKRFAPFGLYLSGLAALTAIVLYFLQRSFSLAIQICLVLVVISLALAILLNPKRARELITGRQAKYGSNVVIAFIALLGIVIALNYIVSNHTIRWDLTEDSEHSLAPETLEVLKTLTSPVQANAFFTADYPSETAANILESFKYNSNGKFDYKFINPDTDPILAQQAGITLNGSVVLTMDNRSETLTYVSEQDVASALIRLSNPGERIIYFLTSHGEFDTTSSSDAGLSQLTSTLESKNYTVKILNLLTNPTIPSDALSVVIAGNTENLDISEIRAIQAYQDNGGSLVVWATPKILTNIGTSTETLSDYLFSEWDLSLGLDMIVDLNITDQPYLAYGTTYGQHPIVENLGTLATIFPYARSVTTSGNPLDSTLTMLVSTSKNSWAETELTGLGNNQVSPDEGKDLLGPVSLAYAGINNSTGARIVVVGNAEFATNAYYTQYGNLDFAINSIDWAAYQDNLLNLTSKQTTTRTLITPTVMIRNVLLLVSVVLLPGIVLVIGTIVWVQRRKRG
jgi:ABC-type uncharacterized transport system involved in gliding motility auxiliary subunit